MNERIKQLMIQATVREPYYPAGNDGHPEYMTYVSQEKFAELIVRECADWIDRQDESRCPYGIDLLEHFGVEE
jgi:hypothetical protein